MANGTRLKVLALDGGGVRGIAHGVYLQELVNRSELNFHDFDIVIGTSTGGLTAAWILLGHDIDKLAATIKEKSPTIFPSSKWRDRAIKWGRRVGPFLRRPTQIPVGARYPVDGLVSVIRTLTKDQLPRDFNQTYFYVTAVDTDNSQLKIIALNNHKDTFNTKPPDISNKIELKDALRMTTAAPSYFSIGTSGYADGGIALNNPSLAGWWMAHRLRMHREMSADTPIDILSIGTGHPKRRKNRLSVWTFSTLLDSVLHAPGKVMNGVAKSLVETAGGSFLRLEPPEMDMLPPLDCSDENLLNSFHQEVERSVESVIRKHHQEIMVVLHQGTRSASKENG